MTRFKIFWPLPFPSSKCQVLHPSFYWGWINDLGLRGTASSRHMPRVTGDRFCDSNPPIDGLGVIWGCMLIFNRIHTWHIMACVFTFFLGSCDRLRRTWTFRWFASWSSLFSSFPSLDQRQSTWNLRQLKAVTGRVGEGHRRFRTSSSLKEFKRWFQYPEFFIPGSFLSLWDFWASQTLRMLKRF